MNIEKCFLDIKDLLHSYQDIYQLEALEQYPLGDKYQTWLKELAKLDMDQKIELHNHYSCEFIELNEYKTLLTKIKTLTKIPVMDVEEKEIPKELSSKISLKKRHEIGKILSLKNLNQSDHFIDIGSGAAHLSSCLLFNNLKTSSCIDLNSEFQEIGKKKLTRFAPELLKRIEFITQEFSSHNHVLNHKKKSTLIGLHACGDLSHLIIEAFKNSSVNSLINFGCCYHKLSKSAYNLSRLAKDKPISFSNHALTMAAKFKYESAKTYQEKLKVKRYRYTLHLLMKNKLDLEFKSIGNALKEDYDLTFSDYCIKFLPDAAKFQKSELEEFFIKSKHEVQAILNLGLLRSHFARLIEIYITLDRVLYLQENNFEVEMGQLFDENISPRNLMISATRI